MTLHPRIMDERMNSKKKYFNFNYNYAQFGGYAPNSVNLGDYVQSIAAQQFLPRVGAFVDRDDFGALPNDPGCRLIANGWYHLSDSRHVPPPEVRPLYVAFHINNVEDAQKFPNLLSRLKAQSRETPVGCRDLGTWRFLRQAGVESYFSSCLTTTLERGRFTHAGERRGVVFGVCQVSCRK